MKVSVCFGFLLCVSFSCHAQPHLDSLKSLLKKARSENRLKTEMYQCYQIGLAFYKANQFDSAIHYYKIMLDKAPDDQTRASALNSLGMVHAASGFSDRSIQYYTDALRIYEALNDTASAVKAGQNLAIIYFEKSLYDDALEISFNTLSKLENQKPDRTLANSYNTIGQVYAKIADYAKSYEYYRKALEIRLSLGYDIGVGQSYNNIGEMFNMSGQYDSALTNLAKAAAIRERIKDERGLGRTLTLTGNALLKLGKTKEAQHQFREALTISRTANDKFAQVYALHGLAAANMTLRDFRSSEQNLQSAAELIEITKSRDDLRQNLELRADLYKSSGDKTKLVPTLERLIIVKDSLLNEEKIESLLSLEIQYQTEKKGQEILVLQQQTQLDRAELEQNRTMIIALIVITALFAVIAALVYRLYRLTRQAKESAELHTKELHHRVTNNLQILTSFFTIQAGLIRDEKAAEVIKSTEGRVNAMMLIHKKLFSKQNATELHLREYANELINYLLFLYGYKNKVALDISVADIKLNAEKAIPIGLVLNELVSNALKYAYSDQTGPVLRIHINKEGSQIVVNIGDNGTKPITINDLAGNPSFGLKMVRSLIREVNGKIESRVNNGTEYLITIPA